jgi:hypothetical protein
MSSKYPPLTTKQVKRGLKILHFKPRPRTSGTSHEHWVKIVNGRIYKVTVDSPKSPFSHDLIKSMASQAGVSKKEFYKACLK